MVERVAIVRIDPLAVVRRFDGVPARIYVPGVIDVHLPRIGFEARGHRLVNEVIAGSPPHEYSEFASETLSLNGNTLTRTLNWADPPLADVKAQLKAKIDRQAEKERLKHITDGCGQALEYERVRREIVAYNADASPTEAEYPMLAASIGVDGVDLAAVVATVSARESAWTTVGAAIRGVRLKAKRDIDAATTAKDAVDVWKAVTWPS